MIHSIFIDTNVVLDLVLDRKPFSGAAQDIFELVNRGRLEGMVSALTVANLHYIARKSVGTLEATVIVAKLRLVVKVLPVSDDTVEWALTSTLPDFEDALQCRAAMVAQASEMVTRNKSDFAGAPLSVLTPAEFLTIHFPDR